MSVTAEPGTATLYEHQREGIAWLRDHPRALLADEPGLGKSLQALRGATEPILVQAPAMVLDAGTWDDEVEKWAPGADVTQVPYSSMFARGPKGRIARDGNGVPQVWPKPEYQRRWGTVICDESHYLTGRKTSWTVATRKLVTDRMELVTGTPIPNWAHEAFSSLQLIRPDEARAGRQFGSYWRWAKEWFQVGPTLWSPMAVGDLRPDRTWEEFREQNWGDRMLLRLRDDCLDLPPLTQQLWRVRMTREQRRVYRELERDFITWLDEARTKAIVAWNSAAQVVKLAKAATGLEVLDPAVRGSGKLDALRAILADRPRPTLVVAHFRDSVAACAQAAEEVGATVRVVDGGVSRPARKSAVRSFQRGNLDVLCATVETVGEGLNLQIADQIVRVERSWRPSRNEQVLRRIHRVGQDRPCLCIDLVSVGTVDEQVLALLAAKTDNQMKALGTNELRGLARAA